MFRALPLVMACMLLAGDFFAQDTSRRYDAHRALRAPVIDGRIDAGEWAPSAWSEAFVDITGDPGRKPRLGTRFRMLWDSNFLYIAAELEEPDLWATLTERDAIVFRDHDFEVFLDPTGDTEQYFEIEINAMNTVMDLFMNKPYRKGGTYDIKWDAGMTSSVRLDGTLNDHSDRDGGWTVEMAIPFEGLRRPGRIWMPERDAVWRINFSRVQWPLQHNGKGYAKIKDASGRNLPEDNWVWNPIGVVNMHIPERWGYLRFR